ncbi:hypothetical protein M413DRAFT_444121 [Hebeloma cylindrosporum]|uniref:DNA damage-binding protein 1 n=1 Tax=Hebeloma cylindrosporum TaxID=76867 RepID=A0A0C2YQL3_HEBCY|nr:hypothetical protein M413DRAFT_444121 [Hebeloma cylindrosporum h7]
MKIVSTFHPSSSVLSSVKCRLGTRDIEHLVVAKLSRLDVYSVRSHGLQHECGVEVWGKICAVRAIPLSSYEPRSNLAKGASTQLIVQKSLSLFERLPRVAEFFTDFLVHPSGKLAIVSCYAGKLKIIPLKAGKIQDEFDVSLPEINILSLAFLPTSDDEYTLGILHLDSQCRVQLLARDIDVDGLEFSPDPSTLFQPTRIEESVVNFPETTVPQLISVPPDNAAASDDAFPGGVMVVGGRQILLFELASKESQEKQRGKQKRLDAKKKSTDPAEVAKARAKERERGERRRNPKFSLDWPWSSVSAWCDAGISSRILIGDSFGRLSMLSLDNINEFGMILIPLGETSPPTTMTYLTHQTFYLGSHLGDSQLLQLSQTPNSQNSPPALTMPVEIRTVSPGSLMTKSSTKGKGRAILQDDDMDIDGDIDCSKGRIVEPDGSFIKVLENFKNIAPIMDAILVDVDGSGQNQIVTCSGGANTGSINIVRNGAEFQELGFVGGLTGVNRIWAVRETYEDSFDTRILMSTVNETHIFQIVDSETGVKFKRLDVGPMSGLISNQSTLAFSNFLQRQNGAYVKSSPLVVQVVPTGAFLLDWDSPLNIYVERDSWDVKNAPQSHNKPVEIVAASVNGSQVALALSGGNIIVLCIEYDASKFKELIKHSAKSEISAVSFIPLNPQKPFSMNVVVSYWSSNIIELFTIEKGTLTSSNETRTPPLPAVVRSILLYNFGSDTSSKGSDYQPYLLAGLGDGSVVSFTLKDGSLKDQKILSLGHAPVTLTPCVVDGKKSVFAAGNRATVFFCDKNRLVNSAVVLKEIAAGCKLNTRLFPSSIILATPTGLSIGSVRNLNKIHIRSTFLGLDNPRQITHEPLLKAFGVACSRTEPTRVESLEIFGSSFYLLDDTSLTRLGQYKCNPNEEIISVVSFTGHLEAQQRPFFCLGTIVHDDEDKEPTQGRLLILSAYTSPVPTQNSTVELSLLTSTEVNGCVYALKVVKGKIIAAINSSVRGYPPRCLNDFIFWEFQIQLFDFDISSDETDSPTFSIKKLADWNHNYMVTSLGSFEDRVVAGDQISSVTLLKATDSSLVSEAKDYGPLYPLAVEALDASNVIASNDTLNIVVFELSKNLRGAALERVGYFHVADMVSKFLRGSLVSTDRMKGSEFSPEMGFFTTSGRIGVISNVEDKDLPLHLTDLERNLAAFTRGVGGKNHTRFRAPKNTRGTSDSDGAAYGFLDGDFLETFINLQTSPDLLKNVMAGGNVAEKLKLPKEDFLKVLEKLQNLH